MLAGGRSGKDDRKQSIFAPLGWIILACNPLHWFTAKDFYWAVVTWAFSSSHLLGLLIIGHNFFISPLLSLSSSEFFFLVSLYTTSSLNNLLSFYFTVSLIILFIINVAFLANVYVFVSIGNFPSLLCPQVFIRYPDIPHFSLKFSSFFL